MSDRLNHDFFDNRFEWLRLMNAVNTTICVKIENIKFTSCHAIKLPAKLSKA